MEKYKKNLAIAAFGIGIIGLMAFVFLKSADSEEKTKKEIDETMKEINELKKKILKKQRSAAIQNFIE